MGQDHLSDLQCSHWSDLARELNYDSIIELFAS